LLYQLSYTSKPPSVSEARIIAASPAPANPIPPPPRRRPAAGRCRPAWL